MDVLEILVVFGAAVLGALFTAVGTWWVSVRLDRQREHRSIASAVGVLAGELEDNRRRIDDRGHPVPLKDRLSIGDWSAMKGSFAGLALRDPSLWRDVADMYGVVYEVISGWQVDTPTSDELAGLVRRLHDQQAKLRDEIRAFSRLRPSRSDMPAVSPRNRPSDS